VYRIYDYTLQRRKGFKAMYQIIIINMEIVHEVHKKKEKKERKNT